MKKILGLMAAFAFMLPAGAQAGDLIFSSDFGAATRELHNKKSGSFDGLLPDTWWEDYSGWTDSIAKTEKITENNSSFLRFNVERYGSSVQFRAPVEKLEMPGIYKIEIEANTHLSSLNIGFRQIPAPYKSLWGDALSTNGKWMKKTFFAKLDKDIKSPVGFFIYPDVGITDIKSISISKATLDDMAAMIPRADKSLKNFFRNSRFPLGVPCGWNIEVHCSKGTVSGDSSLKAPSGCPPIKIEAPEKIIVFSEPFQTSDPTVRNTAALSFMGKGEWTVSVVQGRTESRVITLNPSETEWKREYIEFSPDKIAKGMALKIAGKGVLYIDSLHAYASNEKRPYESAGEAEIALAPIESEASDIRVQFDNAPKKVRYSVSGNFDGAVMKSIVANVYGVEKALPELKLDAKNSSGTISFDVFPETPYGQFRIESWLEKDGKRVSPYSETVVSCFKKPRYWGKDAPNSPFGGHFLSTPFAIKLMKSGGLNWARLHDAGFEYIGWYWLEPEKGKWTFFDEDIKRYRDGNIKIFAQLGTAPKWASYYSDTDLKSSGYFDRYFIPKDNNDYANYVKTVVARYKGLIDEYFVWNEPWGKWWAASYDKTKSEYVRGKDSEAGFAEMTKVAYKAAKEADPTVKISGFNSTSGNDGYKWTKGVYDAGSLEFCDIIDYHYYTPKDVGFEADGAETAYRDAIGYIKEKSPSFKQPVYMSEGQGTCGGSSSNSSCDAGIYKHTIPWKSEADQILLADMTCRYVVSTLANNVSKVFLYSSGQYRNLTMDSLFQTLMAGDGFANPSLAAFSNMAWHLEDMKFVQKLPLSKDVLAYIFEGKRGACAVISGKRGVAYKIPASDKFSAEDLFGNPLKGDLVFNGNLIFIESKLPAAKLAALLNGK